MWLSDFRVVLPQRVLPRGSVRVQGGRIAEIAEQPVRDAGLRGDGLLLMPGFIDMHGDMIEREVEPRPGLRMPLELGLRDLDRRLAGSGVTTAFAAVSFHPGGTHGQLRSLEHGKALLRELKALRGRLSIDHRVQARFEVNFSDALAVIGELIVDGTVDLVSLTDHTPGQGRYRDLERHVRQVALNQGMSEDDARQVVQARIESKQRGVADIAANLRAISRLCALHGIALASHDDDTPEKVALMQGLGASMSEFPVTSEAAAEARARGLATVMGAPNALRGKATPATSRPGTPTRRVSSTSSPPTTTPPPSCPPC